MMHGDILPAIPIVTPIYAVTAPKWQHLPAITTLCPHLPAITGYFVSTKWLVHSVQLFFHEKNQLISKNPGKCKHSLLESI